MDSSEHENCKRVREILSEDPAAKELNLLEVDGERISQHLESCAACKTWQENTNEIVDMARMMPQFDVSERLTQDILTLLANEDKSRQQQMRWVVYAAAMVFFLYILFFVDALESAWGIGSWVVGLTTMIGLKLLIAEPKKERQVV